MLSGWRMSYTLQGHLNKAEARPSLNGQSLVKGWTQNLTMEMWLASCYTQKRANQRPIYIWKDLKSLLTQEMFIKMMTFWIELENIERHSKNYSTMKLPENLSQSLERDIKPWQSGRKLGIFHYCWEEEWKLVLVFGFFGKCFCQYIF